MKRRTRELFRGGSKLFSDRVVVNVRSMGFVIAVISYAVVIEACLPDREPVSEFLPNAM
jgi:hypothetical protein